MPVTIGGSGPITGVTSINTTVSDTELGYLDGVTSALQTQLAGKADTTGNGAWTAYTCTWSGLTVGNGTSVAAYIQIGKVVHFRCQFTFGSTSAMGSGSVGFTLPTSTVANVGGAYARAMLLDSGVGYWPAIVWNTTIFLPGAAGTYVNTANFSTTAPFTWSTNDQITVNGTYEAA